MGVYTIVQDVASGQVVFYQQVMNVLEFRGNYLIYVLNFNFLW